MGELMGDAAVAIGIGLMVGLEREHHEAEERHETPLGVRTFALVALLGWLCGTLGAAGQSWLPPVAFLVTGLLLGASYLRALQKNLGLTTEVATLIVLVLGMIVSQSRLLAVALGVATTLLLFSKPWFEAVIPKLKRMDFQATVQMAVLLAIVLPLLPEEARDPWQVLSPRRIGLFVTLIVGVDYVGYVLNRTLGKERGAGLTGLIGGLTSSTAVTAAMAQDARRDPSGIPAGQLATFLANGVMAARVLVIAAVVSRQVALAVAPAVGAMLVCFLGAAFWRWRTLSRTPSKSAPVELKNPMAIIPALRWGIFLSVVLVAAAVGKQLLGDRGLLAAAALSGLADVDAITLTASRGAEAGTLGMPVAVLAIIVAASTNNVVKAGIALVSGGKAFGRAVALVFGAALVAGVTVAVVTGL